MVAELVGCRRGEPGHPPARRDRLTADDFARFKREVIVEMAGIAARLHAARAFHKDLYLCHFFLDPDASPAGRRLTLIDLHRLAVHRLAAWRWRWKDLGQLLYSTAGSPGSTTATGSGSGSTTGAAMRLAMARLEARAIRAKAARYLAHNRPTGP